MNLADFYTAKRDLKIVGRRASRVTTLLRHGAATASIKYQEAHRAFA
jgi:hypothetical protein